MPTRNTNGVDLSINVIRMEGDLKTTRDVHVHALARSAKYSAQLLVETLVIECARHRRQSLSECARMRRHDMGIERLPTRPFFDNGKVVWPSYLLEHFIADVAVIPGSFGTHGLEQCQAIVQVVGSDVDVGENIDCVDPTFTHQRLDISTTAHALVVRCAQNLLEFVAKAQSAHGFVMTVERGFVLPNFQD